MEQRQRGLAALAIGENKLDLEVAGPPYLVDARSGDRSRPRALIRNVSSTVKSSFIMVG